MEMLENTEQNFQEQNYADLMLLQATEQLKQYDMPRQQSETQDLKTQIYELKEENRAYACQVAQLQTQIEVQQIADKHARE